jgi:hypothetical protein
MGVWQQPLVLCHGRRLGLSKDNVPDGKQQGGGQDGAKYEGGHDKP